MDYEQTYLDIAFEEPWLFVCLVMIFGVYRAFKFLSKKLFDDDKGIVTNYVQDLKNDSKHMKNRIADAFDSIKGSVDQIDRVENNIVTKLDQHKEELVQHINNIKGNE